MRLLNGQSTGINNLTEKLAILHFNRSKTTVHYDISPTPSLKGSYVIDLEPYRMTGDGLPVLIVKMNLQQIGHTKEWVQMNHSFTQKKERSGACISRYAPYSEIKMVRCIAGAVFDVIIDLRKDSQLFCNGSVTELSAANKKMLYIPEGFAHGFQTLDR